MSAIIKILIGFVILAAGFGLFVDSVYENQWTGVHIAWWNNFVVTLTGVIPAMLILVGLFVIWLEADELKAKKEVESEVENIKDEVKNDAAPAEEESPKEANEVKRRRGRPKKKD